MKRVVIVGGGIAGLAAAYRLQNYSHASEAYSAALLSNNKAVREQAHFGLGNTEYYKGLALKDASGGTAGQRKIRSRDSSCWESCLLVTRLLFRFIHFSTPTTKSGSNQSEHRKKIDFYSFMAKEYIEKN